MTPRFSLSFLFFALTLTLTLPPLIPDQSACAFDRPPHHHLVLDIRTGPSGAQVEDKLTLYPHGLQTSTLTFLLDGRFQLEPVEIPHKGDWKVDVSPTTQEERVLHRIQVTKPHQAPWPDFVELIFRYRGPYRDLQSQAADQNKLEHTLVLAGDSIFYPILTGEEEEALLTFSLETVTPPGWQVISQGKRTGITTGEGRVATTWSCDDPMEEIFLIADRYHEYRERMEDVSLYVFLRSPDPELAKRYLDSTRKFIKFYQKLIGSYPFVKMAVVENSEQTGYGMPSFTLLGSRIIRFPFILKTSLPHEILHNWWGNGVYVDPDSGNWSEGLTAYLSDHLFPDITGNGPQYRFQELMKYLNYVTPSNDFPLTDFNSRTDMASQALGYGKWLMVLHMLRQRIGDKAFLEGLNGFYRTQLFKRSGVDSMRRAFEQVSGEKLKSFFDHWTQSTGAPELELVRGSLKSVPKGKELRFTLVQAQTGPLHPVEVPALLYFADGRPPRMITTLMTQKTQEQTVLLGADEDPVAIQADPYHDVFRRLNRNEVPPSIGQTYGDSRAQVLWSMKSDPHYRELAESLENENISPPAPVAESGSSKWILGRHHPEGKALLPWLKAHGVTIKDSSLLFKGKSYSWEQHSIVLTVPQPDNPRKSATWVITPDRKPLPGLIRKLPHYGKYGFLVFEGPEPRNVAKLFWPADSHQLIKWFTNKRTPLPLPKRPPLAQFPAEY